MHGKKAKKNVTYGFCLSLITCATEVETILIEQINKTNEEIHLKRNVNLLRIIESDNFHAYFISNLSMIVEGED